MVVLLLQGWDMTVNSIGTVPYGISIALRVGHGAELAASIVENPSHRVGLAATIVDLAVGLAASFGKLTGYIWIWQFLWCATVCAF